MPNGKWCYKVDAKARTQYNYSEDLCTIVDDCLRYEPDARPTSEQLETWILQKISANAWLANQSDKNAAKTVAELQNSGIFEKNHRHHVGMALSEFLQDDASTVGGAGVSLWVFLRKLIRQHGLWIAGCAQNRNPSVLRFSR